MKKNRVEKDNDEMNYRCNKFNVGDKGQRYEVYYKDSAGKEHLFGWTNEEDGGVLVDSINLNPSMTFSRIVDRGFYGPTLKVPR